MITSKEICQAMDKNQKCKIEGIKPKECKGSISNWLRKVRIKICALLAFFISNIVGNIFLRSSISGSKH